MKRTELRPFGDYLLELARKYGKGQVFEDFLQIVVCCLQMGRAEELYFKTIRRYQSEELSLFSMAFASLVDEMTRKPLEDPFGDFFQEHLSSAKNGQFFTPQSVSDLMAQLINVPKVDEDRKKDTDKRIFDPCCGSGRLLLSYAKIERKRYFVAADISYTCCLMTLINMCLYSLSGEVLHMNSLQPEICWHRWLVIVDTASKLPSIYEVTENDRTPPTSSADLEPIKLTGNVQPIKDMIPQVQFVRFSAKDK